MNTRFVRWSSPLTLLAWGGMFVYFYASGRLESFLHPSFRWLVLVSGIGMTAIGLLLVFCCAPSVVSESRGDASMGGGWLKPLVLLLPIVAAAFVSPDGFGAAFVRNRSGAGVIPPPPAVNAVSKSEYLKTNADGRVKAELLDLRYAAQSVDLRKDLEHKNLETIGQYLPANGSERGHFTLTRLFVICCSADAQPINVTVETSALSPLPSDLKEMAWLAVVGTVRFEHPEQPVALPVITAASIRQIPVPKEKYLY